MTQRRSGWSWGSAGKASPEGTWWRFPEEAPSRLRPRSWRWHGQERCVLGTGDRKQGLLRLQRPDSVAGKGPGRVWAPRSHLSHASLPFAGPCLRGCGAISGKCRHRGFLWPCSGPSSLSLFATVCFTGPCTLTQLLTLISWSRKSDGWKPRSYDWHCRGSERPLHSPCPPSSGEKGKRTSYFRP